MVENKAEQKIESQMTEKSKSMYGLTPDMEDELTHLYNRAGFYKKAEEMIEAHAPGHYILTCINIDSFKVINDQFGTDIGDEVLKHVAVSISECLEGEDAIVARISADDFAVLYTAAYSENAKQHIEAAHSRACAPNCIRQRIHTRVGRYFVTDKSLDITNMFDRAKIAADSIRGHFTKKIEYYSEDMREKLIARQRILFSMAEALERGEFEVWLQPQYNHATGAAIGSEALARWKHEGNYIPPSDFIPVFEETDFIYELDLYMWEQCCRLLRRHIDEGNSPLPISVNISRRDIIHDDFPATLVGIVQNYDIPINLFRLEITESAFSGDAKQTISKIRDLSDMGYIIEIDDFGSGYSTLNTLKDVPSSVLKLDMRFFENTENNKRAGTIIEAVVRMAKWLDMAVIAEGVETKHQADYLKSIGCYYIQGYYYARPMPVVEFEKLAAKVHREPELTRLKTLKTFDNNDFWDPESMDTLIFNSYIGGACIFEYAGRKTELLRVNDQFFEIFSNGVETMENLDDLSLASYLEEKEREKFYDTIEEAIATKSEAECELRIALGGRVIYAHDTVRIIASTDDKYLCYCSVADVTKRCIAEKHEWENSEQLKFLNDTAHELLAQPDPEDAIIRILRKSLDYFKGNRAFVMELDISKNVLNCRYEVLGEGAESRMGDFQGISAESSLRWFGKDYESKPVTLLYPAEFPDDVAGLRDKLMMHSISSYIAAPMLRNGELIGYVGVDEPKRADEHLSRLSALGDYVAILIRRRDLNRYINRDTGLLLEIVDGMPGGFARLKYKDENNCEVIYVNKGLNKLSGLSTEEMTDNFSEGLYAYIHPDDRKKIDVLMDELLSGSGSGTVRCHKQHKNGSWVEVSITAHAAKDSDENVYFNIFFTDAKTVV